VWLNPTDSWCRAYPKGVFFQGSRFVRQWDIFVVDTEEDQLISKQSRYCLAAVMQSYKKQSSDAQWADDTTFDDE
jgi:hypothetical protein